MQIQDRFRNQKLIIQGIRVAVFVFLLGLALMVHLNQGSFFSWDFYWQFYLITAVGLTLNVIGMIALEGFFRHPRILFISFFLDIFLVALLLFNSELSVSLFLFIFLIEILLIALVFQTRGALLLAAWSSLCFSIVSLVGPELKAMTFFFTFILYNLAFFAVAWIAGMIAEQLEAQGLTLNQLRAMNESIVDTIPAGLLTLNLDGFIISANPGARQIFKIDALEGLDLKAMLPDFAGEIEKHLAGASKAQDAQEKVEIPLKRESDNLLLQAQILPHQSNPSDILVVLEDVTELRRLELTLLHQQKLAAIGGLASGIAHELGNPLAAISANIQYLEPKIRIDDETDKKLISNTHREIARLGRLIGEFKDYAKPEKVPVDLVRLDQVLKEVLEIVAGDKTLKQDIVLHTDLSEVGGIRGAKDKLVQAFLNVIINAYHAVGEVRSTATVGEESSREPGTVQVSCKTIGLEVVVRVRDNGVGMSDETKARLFEPFYTTKGRIGTGLGLAITYKILQSHNAKISIDSKKGQGSEFIFRFPIKT